MQKANKSILISGGAKGIGKAICMRFCKASDYKIFFSYNSSSSEALELEKEIRDKGVYAKACRCDVTDSSQIENFVNTAIDKAGKIDVFVNNAGITKDSLILRMKDKDWFDVINTNLNPCFFFTKLISKSMLKQRYGKIINIGSVVGVSGNAGQSNYAASKAALIGFTKSISKELASRNITANVVLPGFIESDMTKNMDEEQKQEILKNIPLKKIGKADEVANLVYFLASDEASYITGQSIHINGGMYP